jgi:hypothetical protein
MVKEPRNKMQMENILIFKIKWKTMKTKKNNRNKLNKKMKIWDGTCKEPFWRPPFL